MWKKFSLLALCKKYREEYGDYAFWWRAQRVNQEYDYRTNKTKSFESHRCHQRLELQSWLHIFWRPQLHLWFNQCNYTLLLKYLEVHPVVFSNCVCQSQDMWHKMCWDFHISTSVLEHDGLKKKKTTTILLNISTCIITKRDTVNKTND